MKKEDFQIHINEDNDLVISMEKKTEESLILNIREGFIKEVLYNDYFSVKITEKKRTFVTYNR